MHQASSEPSARSSAGPISRGSVTRAPPARPAPRPSGRSASSAARSRPPLPPKNDSCWIADLAPAAVVADDARQRQAEANGGLHLHAVEAEGAVAGDQQHAPSGWRSLAAIANDGPTPRQPSGPGSSHCPGRDRRTIFEAQPTTSPPSPTTSVSGVRDGRSPRPAIVGDRDASDAAGCASSRSAPSLLAAAGAPVLPARAPARRDAPRRAAPRITPMSAGDADVQRAVAAQLGGIAVHHARRARPRRTSAAGRSRGGSRAGCQHEHDVGLAQREAAACANASG